jgi:hypothetical protein
MDVTQTKLMASSMVMDHEICCGAIRKIDSNATSAYVATMGPMGCERPDLTYHDLPRLVNHARG